MGSRENAIVAYSRSRSPSRRRQRYRSRSRSRSKPRRSRSQPRRLSDFGGDGPSSERTRMGDAKVEQKRLAKEQAASLAKTAQARVEAAKQALETAIQEAADRQSAELEAAKELEDAIRERSQLGEEDRIQKVVDERQEARRSREFSKADRLLEELRHMGVQMNDNDLTWTGPNGLSGEVKGVMKRRAGDWNCPSCQSLCYGSKDKCFKCGTRKSGDAGGDQRRDGRRRSPSCDRRGNNRRGRRSPSYDSGRRKRRRKSSGSSSS